MDTIIYILQITGSIASILAVPSIYSYFKSRKSKLYLEIVMILAHKIGGNSEITLFELNAVIKSKAREHRVDYTRISPSEIIDDLATETINNPMLENKRKDEIILNLKKLQDVESDKTLLISENIVYASIIYVIFYIAIMVAYPAYTETNIIKLFLEEGTTFMFLSISASVISALITVSITFPKLISRIKSYKQKAKEVE